MARAKSLLAAACAAGALLLGPLGSAAHAQAASAPEVVKIWPGAAPGTEDWTGPEKEYPLKVPGVPAIHMVTNITTPTLTVYRPAPGHANGTAVIVAPGGGFQFLAITHEGTMVAQRLADHGYTAFVLKYRVRQSGAFAIPPEIREHPERFDAFFRSFAAGRKLSAADGVQAVRYVRSHAAAYGVQPDRVGFMGFSAGAITTMDVVLNSAPADRPNFGAPIYGAMAPDAVPPKNAPPLFIAATQDDNAVPIRESLRIFSAWTAAGLPAELHVYERGGHGFGMVPHHLPVDNWADAFEAWLTMHGWGAPAAKTGG